MLYTFYSYKGGVGRSMALVNIAELFYKKGLRVLMVDWDLEAPGLERYFTQMLNLQATLKKPGLMDLLLDYKAHMAQDVIVENELLTFTNPKDYVLDIYNSNPAKLYLLTAGQRADLDSYAKTVLNFDWQDFYENWEGELYFDWLREQFEIIADVVLIDSRTGVTEMSGVCTYHLADVIVLCCAPNQQNIKGTHQMLEKFMDDALIELRDGRKLQCLVIPTRVEATTSINRLNNFRSQFDDIFSKYLPESLRTNNTKEFFQALEIPYIGDYAFDELVAVNETKANWVPQLVEAYENLWQKLVQLVPAGSTIQKRLGLETTEFPITGLLKLDIFDMQHNQQQTHFLSKRVTHIGRSSKNDIVLKGNTIAPLHIQLVRLSTQPLNYRLINAAPTELHWGPEGNRRLSPYTTVDLIKEVTIELEHYNLFLDFEATELTSDNIGLELEFPNLYLSINHTKENPLQGIITVLNTGDKSQVQFTLKINELFKLNESCHISDTNPKLAYIRQEKTEISLYHPMNRWLPAGSHQVKIFCETNEYPHEVASASHWIKIEPIYHHQLSYLFGDDIENRHQLQLENLGNISTSYEIQVSDSKNKLNFLLLHNQTVIPPCSDELLTKWKNTITETEDLSQNLKFFNSLVDIPIAILELIGTFFPPARHFASSLRAKQSQMRYMAATPAHLKQNLNSIIPTSKTIPLLATSTLCVKTEVVKPNQTMMIILHVVPFKPSSTTSYHITIQSKPLSQPDANWSIVETTLQVQRTPRPHALSFFLAILAFLLSIALAMWVYYRFL